jgi:DNA-binding IclR family transcriptional regulator
LPDLADHEANSIEAGAAVARLVRTVAAQLYTDAAANCGRAIGDFFVVGFIGRPSEEFCCRCSNPACAGVTVGSNSLVMADESSSTSLIRAIAILTVLGSPGATGGEGIGVVQIARLVGREKSQVSRTLKTLAEAGFVMRDPDTLRYSLGWRVFTLAASAADQRLLILTPRVLRQLVASVGEAAHLSVLEGREVLTLLSETPARAIQAAPWVGRVAPLHCTSAGRALLFDHTDAEVRAQLEGTDLAAGGPNAPRDVEQVLARLHQARRCGHVEVDEEFEPGHVAVAAPVRDFRSRVFAALNISAPKFRLGRSLPAAGRLVKLAADQLSHALIAAPRADPSTPASAETHSYRRIS